MTIDYQRGRGNERDPLGDKLADLRDVATKIVDDVRPPYTTTSGADLHQAWTEMRDKAALVDSAIPLAEAAMATLRDDTIAEQGRMRMARESLDQAHRVADEATATLRVHVEVFKAQLISAAVGKVNPARSAEAKADARDLLSVAATTTDLVDAAQTMADSTDDNLAALAGSDWMQRFLTARGVADDTVRVIRDRVILRNARHHSSRQVRDTAALVDNIGKLDSLPTVRRTLVKQTIRQAETRTNPYGPL